jgi:hypothetical protein
MEGCLGGQRRRGKDRMRRKESQLGVSYPRKEQLSGAQFVKELDTIGLLAVRRQVLVIQVVVLLSPMEQVVVLLRPIEEVLVHHSHLEEILFLPSPLEQVVVVHSQRGNLALQLVLKVPKDSALSYLFKASTQKLVLHVILHCILWLLNCVLSLSSRMGKKLCIHQLE